MGSLATLPTWEEKVRWARSQRDASLAKVEPKLEGMPTAAFLPLSSQELPKAVLTPREIELTEGFTVTELLAHLRERKVTVEEVTRAFLRRAALAHAAVSMAHSAWNAMAADVYACHTDKLPH